MAEDKPAREARLGKPPDDNFKRYMRDAVDRAVEHHKAICPEEQVDAEVFASIPLGCLAALQDVFLENAGSFPREDHARASQAITLIVAAINTMSHNPLYRSYAVFDQFRHHVDMLMNTKSAIEIVENEDG